MFILPDSPEEKERARIRNDQIDSELASEAAFLSRKRRSEVTVLLLGQSESGKSTLQKQLQLLYAPHSLESERSAWRGVIYANIISTVRAIIDGLDPENYGRNATMSSPVSDEAEDVEQRSRTAAVAADLMNLKFRLSPLLSMESTLADRLGAGYHTDSTTGVSTEMYLRRGWQLLSPPASPSSRSRRPSMDVNGRPSLERDEAFYEASRLLQACSEDIKALYNHRTVQKLIKRRKLILKESSTVFLNDLDRIVSQSWVPSNEDILYARVRTVGIAEYNFEVKIKDRVVNWRVFDVGGTVGQRQAWIPYFEGSSAIIFLAPVSAFDQYLDEDPEVNRVEDSIELFTTICAHPLLKRTHIVLFLNKVDILRQKLRSGIKVNKFILSYGDRSNDPETVMSYFKSHFDQAFRRSNPRDENRSFYTHSTTVVDTIQTEKMIGNVLAAILNDHLITAKFL